MRLSLTTKVLLWYLLLSLAFAAVSANSAWQMHEAGRQLRALKDGYLRLYGHAKELQLYHGYLRATFEQEAATWDSVTKDSLALNLSRRSRDLAAARQALATLAALDAPEERTFVARAREDFGWLEARFAEDAREVDHPGPLQVRRERWSKVSVRINQLSRPARQKLGSVADRVSRDEDQARRAAIGGVIASMLFGLLVWLVTRQRLAQLRKLAQGARRLAGGEWGERVPEDDKDEIGALGREFNSMAAALQEREQRLIRSERLAAIGRMAAHIAHEVRNPLSSIGLNAELLEEELQQQPDGARLCRAIQHEVDRLNALTQEYLRFARLPQPKLERQDLRPALTSLLDFIREDARARGVTVVAQLPDSLPSLDLDEGQLRQALLNLCRNAVEAMSGGGTLTVRVAAAGERLEISVADTGAGIAAEHLPRVFEPFFSTKEHGTGLGLALTQHIVAAHGGTISIDSTPGRGTEFVVRLPLLGAAAGGASTGP
ncbi:MAG: HAMP domain-containing protein [Deltaproteobacteria bacterium]|nr:HAMP domain-containing protein [Deltaproteobacteria bacterium]